MAVDSAITLSYIQAKAFRVCVCVCVCVWLLFVCHEKKQKKPDKISLILATITTVSFRSQLLPKQPFFSGRLGGMIMFITTAEGSQNEFYNWSYQRFRRPLIDTVHSTVGYSL